MSESPDSRMYNSNIRADSEAAYRELKYACSIVDVGGKLVNIAGFSRIGSEAETHIGKGKVVYNLTGLGYAEAIVRGDARLKWLCDNPAKNTANRYAGWAIGEKKGSEEGWVGVYKIFWDGERDYLSEIWDRIEVANG